MKNRINSEIGQSSRESPNQTSISALKWAFTIEIACYGHGFLDGRLLPLGVDSVWLAHNLALAVAIGVVLLRNYFVNRRWTFGDVE